MKEKYFFILVGLLLFATILLLHSEDITGNDTGTGIGKTNVGDKKLRLKNSLLAPRKIVLSSGDIINRYPYRFKDAEPPTSPLINYGIAQDSSCNKIRWAPGSDNIEVKEYKIYRSQGENNTEYLEIGTTTKWFYNDTGLYSNTKYNYMLKAFDRSDNSSDFCEAVSVTTWPDNPTEISLTTAPEIIELGDTFAMVHFTLNRIASTIVANYQETGSIDKIPEPITQGYTDYTIKLDPLKPNTSYTFELTIIDGITILTPTLTFTTRSQGYDTLPTFIRTEVSISDKEALLYFETDMPTTALIHISPYDHSPIECNQALVGHTEEIPNLSPGTTYNYSIDIWNSANKGPVSSGPLTFTTEPAPDTAPPMLVSEPQQNSGTDSIIIYSWTTNEPTIGRLEATPLLRSDLKPVWYVDTSYSCEHTAILKNLIPGTEYDIKVVAIDPFGNVTTFEGEQTVSASTTNTGGEDRIPPVLLNYTVLTSDMGATIAWFTDEVSTSRVYFRPQGKDYERIAFDNDPETFHMVRLYDLSADTTYEVRVESTDPSGNTLYAPNLTTEGKTSYVTIKTKPAGTLTALTVSEPTAEFLPGVIVGKWSTNKETYCRISYRKEGDFYWQSTEYQGPAKEHVIKLSDIASGTYDIRLEALDTDNQRKTRTAMDNGTPLKLNIGGGTQRLF